MEADVIVIDPASTELIAHRVAEAESLRDVLFAQIILADDRAVRTVFTNGMIAWDRP